MKGEGLKEFAMKHPFITWFCFGKLCESAVHIVRGYPPMNTITTTTYRKPDETDEDELDESEIEIEPETVNDESEEEA